MEQDEDQVNDDFDRICNELKSVQGSLQRLRMRDSQLKSSIREKGSNVQEQKDMIE